MFVDVFDVRRLAVVGGLLARVVVVVDKGIGLRGDSDFCLNFLCVLRLSLLGSRLGFGRRRVYLDDCLNDLVIGALSLVGG